MATLKTITEQATNATAGAEWARMPKVGETIEGLFRTQLFALMQSGAIKSAAIKAPGALRTGVRLVHIPSVRAYIEQHVVNANGEVGE